MSNTCSRQDCAKSLIFCGKQAHHLLKAPFSMCYSKYRFGSLTLELKHVIPATMNFLATSVSSILASFPSARPELRFSVFQLARVFRCFTGFSLGVDQFGRALALGSVILVSEDHISYITELYVLRLLKTSSYHVPEYPFSTKNIGVILNRCARIEPGKFLVFFSIIKDKIRYSLLVAYYVIES